MCRTLSACVRLAVASWLAVVLLLLLLGCWAAADGQAVDCRLCCLLRSLSLVGPAVLQSRGATTASAGGVSKKATPIRAGITVPVLPSTGHLLAGDRSAAVELWLGY
ncbi:hypothetical protein B0T11DRAFT_86005 [Plectosphaerella cucumerina]|uniref:Secreted protein n=1 Tax=Plectosphaerella cucumerina TaxID=40658 RepID=A0A8K0TFG0_9PEZI|nr:hypothetical protein B0T11DRAFT_86005 [Plectosphaerella cucumerina]